MSSELEYFGIPPSDFRETELSTMLTAAAGQTAFSAVYEVGFAHVWHNGVKLDPASDFTATDGVTVNLAVGAALGDRIEVLSRKQTPLNDFYSKTQLDAKIANYYAIGTGTGDAILAEAVPIVAAFYDGLEVKVRVPAANTVTNPTLKVNALAAKTVVRDGQVSLTVGDWTANSEVTFRYAQAIDKFVLVEGMLTATTPTKGDNTKKYASTEFVKKAIGSFASATSVNATTTLTATNTGQLTTCIGSSAYTITMPLANTVQSGESISFISTNPQTVTVSRQGTNTFQVNGGSVTSYALKAGDTLTLVSDGSSAWVPSGGSAQDKHTAGFAVSLTSSGYQKLPSGLIMQWGIVTTASGSGSTTLTGSASFPITFPTGVISVSTTLVNAGSASAWDGTVVFPGSYTTSTMAVNGVLSTGKTTTGIQVGYIALGY